MRWAVAARLDVDAICYAWLIERFVDPVAEFVFVTEDESPPRDTDTFATDGTQARRARASTAFAETIDRYRLDDPVLRRMAAVVGEEATGVNADVSQEAASLVALCRGLTLMHDDAKVLELATPLLDELFERLGHLGEPGAVQTNAIDMGGNPTTGGDTTAPLAERSNEVDFARVLRYFARLGTLGFGGPIAVVGYMQRDLVERRGWISKKDFLDGVALGQTMPGPLAAQVAMWVGYLKLGAVGAAATAFAFILPSLAMVVAVAAAYAHYSGLPIVQSLFYGIAPAVMAIITIAAYKLVRLTDGKDWRAWTISAVIFAVTATTGREPIYLIVGAGILLILLDARPDWHLPRRRTHPPGTGKLTGIVGLPLASAGLGTLTSASVLVPLGLFFLKTGALVFGSGLAIVPLLRDGVVAQHHWLTQAQFLDAVAMGLITPGPVVITAAFIGYLVAGPLGALVATVAIFTPIYLGVVVPGRWFIRHRDNRQIKAFVIGATAAAGGALSGAVVVLTRQAVVDVATAAIALVTLGLLLRFKRIPEPAFVGAAAVLGILLH